MKMCFRWISLLTMIVFLTACHTVPKNNSGTQGEPWLTSPKAFTQAYQSHAQKTKWRYSSKVGVVTPQESNQANMVWVFDNDVVGVKNNVRLFGPLGIGAIKIEFDEQSVQLSDKNGVVHQGNSAEELLLRIVGWPIPVDALRYWIFSLPQPDQKYVYQLDEQQQLVALKQFGWEINYSGYRQYNKGESPLARKMVARKQFSPGQDVKVTLITKSWKNN